MVPRMLNPATIATSPTAAARSVWRTEIVETVKLALPPGGMAPGGCVRIEKAPDPAPPNTTAGWPVRLTTLVLTLVMAKVPTTVPPPAMTSPRNVPSAAETLLSAQMNKIISGRMLLMQPPK